MDKHNYGYSYYASYSSGMGYSINEHWSNFFGSIASRIVEDFHPKSVLDAGCAWGHLVAALRDRGVDAYGVDISEYAIKNVREDARGFCAVSSIIAPLPETLPQRYDLVTCIEVLEHMDEEEGRFALKNLCQYSDTVIFSSSPDEIADPTHYNVQQVEYWAKRFAENNFIRSLIYLPDYISPQAVLFQKSSVPLPNLVQSYERQLRITATNLKKEKNISQEICANLKNEHDLLRDSNNALQNELNALRENNASLQNELNALRETNASLQGELNASRETNASLQSELDASRENNVTLQNELDAKKEEIEKALRELLTLKLRLANSEGDLSQAKKNVSALRDELQDASHKLSLSNSELASSRDALDALWRLKGEEEAKLKEEEAKLKETQASLEDELNRTRLELSEARAALSSAESLINAYASATFWRITKPLRVLSDLAKSLFRKKPHRAESADESAAGDAHQDIIPPLDPAASKYAEWIALYDSIDDTKRDAIRKEIEGMGERSTLPLISVVMPVYNPPIPVLKEALDSVRSQIYPYWELCIADDASPDPEVRELLSRYAEEDGRIKVCFRSENGHISEASNSALALAQGEFVALLDHDDALAENALYEVARAIKDNPDASLFYSDEDKLDEFGRRCDPYFKPDWNPDMILGQNFFCHLGVYKREILQQIDGFRKGFEGAQDYDLLLRCLDIVPHKNVSHIPKILYHWRIMPGSAARGGKDKPYAYAAAVKAIRECLARRDIKADVSEIVRDVGLYRVKYMPDTLSKTSIIIPTRDRVDLLEKCVTSIQTKTVYPNYEIIVVDNGSVEDATSEYLKKLSQKPNVRILRDDEPFNYSRLNNRAVKIANGEIICLLNNDIEVISHDWLTEMVSHVTRRDIGAVGAKLIYPNNTLQHAGVILGLSGVAGHSHHTLSRDDAGYFYRARVVQNYSAVTGACLVVRKSVYEEVGGLNEQDLSVAFNDVDFCIRVRDAGYRNLWTPFAELYHHESATRGYETTPEKQERFRREIEYMRRTHGEKLTNDPAYNPNLSLGLDQFTLAFPPRGL